MNQPEHAIVVGVPAEGGEAALGFAVEEARRSRSPVHLVHVLQIPAGEPYAGFYTGAKEQALAVLGAAQAQATELAPGEVSVTTELCETGAIVGELVHRSDTARMVVVEHRDLGRVRRFFTGSRSSGVAARAHCAVVVVPAGWRPAVRRHRVVSVAVQHPDEAEEMLRAAFEAARVRSADLVVLHAWWLATGYNDVVVDDVVLEEESRRFHGELAPVLDRFRARYPTVGARVDVRHEPPAEAVLGAAARSDLLVLGRRHHLLALGGHLGPVSRAVIAHSPVPVLMTPEPEQVFATVP